MLATFKTLPELFAAFPTEQHAVDHFTAIRWANGRFCPLCGSTDEARIGRMSKKDGTLTNQWKCYVCREKFSIRVGTIFQDTRWVNHVYRSRCMDENIMRTLVRMAKRTVNRTLPTVPSNLVTWRSPLRGARPDP